MKIEIDDPTGLLERQRFDEEMDLRKPLRLEEHRCRSTCGNPAFDGKHCAERMLSRMMTRTGSFGRSETFKETERVTCQCRCGGCWGPIDEQYVKTGVRSK